MERLLFDEIVYNFFFSYYQEEEEEGKVNQIQPVMRDAVVHLQSVSDYATTSAIGKSTTITTIINQIIRKNHLQCPN